MRILAANFDDMSNFVWKDPIIESYSSITNDFLSNKNNKQEISTYTLGQWLYLINVQGRKEI